MISDLDGAAPARLPRPRTAARRRSASRRDIEEIPTGPQRRDHELLLRRPDRLRARAEARHLGAGPRRPLVDAAGDDRLDVLGLRRHVDGDAARRGRGGAPAAAASRLDAVAGQVGADVDRRARLGRHGAHAGGAGAARGRRARERRSPPTTRRSSPTRSRSRSSSIDVSTGAQRKSMLLTRLRRRRRRRHVDGVARAAGADDRRARSTCPAPSSLAPGGDVAIPVVVRAAADAGDRRELRLRRPHRERRPAPRPLRVPRRAPRAARTSPASR